MGRFSKASMTLSLEKSLKQAPIIAVYVLVIFLYFARLLTTLQVGWKGTAVLMMKTQIGLGVLSIPVAFDALGIVPGVICLIVIAAITTWSDYIIGVFKLRHSEVYGIDDVGQLLLGRTGRIFLGGAFVLCKFRWT